MSSFSDMLAYLRKRERLSQTELAKKLGVSRSTIGMYEAGEREPNFETLEAIADYFNVDMNTLVGGSVPAPAAEVIPFPVREIDPIWDALNDPGRAELCSYGRYLCTVEQYRAKDPPRPDAPAKIVPLLGAAFAAGSPESPGDLFMGDYRTTDLRAEFAIKINGDSMEPWLPDGSVALGVKRLPRDGEVGAFWLDGGFLVKQVCTDPFGTVYLFALNRDRADADDEIRPDAGRDLRTIGTILLDARIPLP